MAPNDPVSGTDAGALRVALEGFVRGGARWSDLEAAGLHVVERGEYGLSFEAAGPVPLIAPSPTDLGAGMLAHAGDPVELRDWARVVLSVADLGAVEPADTGRPLVRAVWAAADGEPVGEDVFALARRVAA